MSDTDGPGLARRLRESTKEIHDTSDKLVNLKLGVAMSDDKVWANGLLVFAKVFFQLEKSLDDYASLADLDVEGMRRTQAFEKDLDFFFGPSWRTQKDSQPVQDYVNHLKKLSEDEPYLLIPYIYHLYMGLLSGGQVLSKKRALTGADQDPEGSAVTTFPEETPSNMKKKLRSATNALGEELDSELQSRIVEEGINVFKWNNAIIKTVEGVNEIFYKKLFKWISILILILAVIIYYFSK